MFNIRLVSFQLFTFQLWRSNSEVWCPMKQLWSEIHHWLNLSVKCFAPWMDHLSLAWKFINCTMQTNKLFSGIWWMNNCKCLLGVYWKCFLASSSSPWNVSVSVFPGGRVLVVTYYPACTACLNKSEHKFSEVKCCVWSYYFKWNRD